MDKPPERKLVDAGRPRKSRGPKCPPSQMERGLKYSRQLKEINIHKPARATTARDVKIMTDLRNMLQQSWQKLWDKVDNFKRFSPKQIEFARQYAINGRRNKSACMRRAGYTYKTYQDIITAANRNLALPYMDDLIAAFEMEEKARMGLRIEDVADYFAKIADTAMENGDFTNANRAMENYGKFLGMFIDRKEVVHKNVYNKDDLDARIRELQAVIAEERETIAGKLAIN